MQALALPDGTQIKFTSVHKVELRDQAGATSHVATVFMYEDRVVCTADAYGAHVIPKINFNTTRRG